MNRFALVAALIVLLMPPATQAVQTELLPQQLAFPISASRDKSGEVLIVFNIQPGYALYRERISITPAGAGTVRVSLPPGIRANDELIGPHQLYRGRTTIRVKAGGPWPQRLVVRSQGCADVGVCYTPHVQFVDVP